MNTQSTLVGLFKEVYGENIVEAWGFMAKLARRINFLQQELRPGNFYNQPVDVQFEHGISEAGAGSVPGATAGVVFFPPTAGQMQNAQIAGAQLIGRAQVSYEAIARSANSKAAFKQATQHIVRRLSQAVVKRLEIHLLHGGRGIGTISSLATESNLGGGSYSSVVTITDESWSTGIWAGMIGAFVDVYQSNTTTARNNTNTSTVTCYITAIDTVNKTVTLQYNGATRDWQAGDVLFLGGGKGGATTATELLGLDFITRLNASAGTFQNIPTGTYDLWRANQYSTSTGVLSFAKLLEAAGLAASYGLMDELVAVISPKAFEVLNSDIAALRQYDVSYKSAQGENGTQGLRFYAQTGIVEIMPHAFQKDGLCHMFAPNEALRVGATDVSFITRQGSEDKLILESATSAASEMRAYSNQSLFCAQPRHTVLMAGITY